MKDRSTAIHEAGHTAMLLLNGYKFKRISILPDDNTMSLGRVELIEGERYNSWIYISVLCAGSAAQIIDCGQADEDDPEIDLSDFAMIERYGSSFSYRALLTIFDETLQTLKENWQLVEMIADCLMYSRELSYEDTYEILADYWKDTGRI